MPAAPSWRHKRIVIYVTFNRLTSASLALLRASRGNHRHSEHPPHPTAGEGVGRGGWMRIGCPATSIAWSRSSSGNPASRRNQNHRRHIRAHPVPGRVARRAATALTVRPLIHLSSHPPHRTAKPHRRREIGPRGEPLDRGERHSPLVCELRSRSQFSHHKTVPPRPSLRDPHDRMFEGL